MGYSASAAYPANISEVDSAGPRLDSDGLAQFYIDYSPKYKKMYFFVAWLPLKFARTTDIPGASISIRSHTLDFMWLIFAFIGCFAFKREILPLISLSSAWTIWTERFGWVLSIVGGVAFEFGVIGDVVDISHGLLDTHFAGDIVFTIFSLILKGEVRWLVIVFFRWHPLMFHGMIDIGGLVGGFQVVGIVPWVGRDVVDSVGACGLYLIGFVMLVVGCIGIEWCVWFGAAMFS